MERYPSDMWDRQWAISTVAKALTAAKQGREVEVMESVEILRKKANSVARFVNYDPQNFLHEALQKASAGGHVQLVRRLLQDGAKPDLGSTKRPTPLFMALRNRHYDVVEILLEHGAPCESRDKQGRTALVHAAVAGAYNILFALIKKGANVDARDHKMRNALHLIAIQPDSGWSSQAIGLLLRAGLSMRGAEAQDDLGRTPLHWACNRGNLSLVALLLKRDGDPFIPVMAEPNAVDFRGRTPLHLAVAAGHSQVIRELVEAGADVNAKSEGNWTALHIASGMHNHAIVQILLEHHADAQAKLVNGLTPFHVAARTNLTAPTKRGPKLTAYGRKNTSMSAVGDDREVTIRLLLPYSDLHILSDDAKDVCHDFVVSVVDFKGEDGAKPVKRHSVYNFLYARDPHEKHRSAMNILPHPRDRVRFRWIHLPANNKAWVEALLMKWILEDSEKNPVAFKMLERFVSDEHRGPRVHSRFMRPLCELSYTARPRPEKSSVLPDRRGSHSNTISANRPTDKDTPVPRRPIIVPGREGNPVDGARKKMSKADQIALRHPRRAKRKTPVPLPNSEDEASHRSGKDANPNAPDTGDGNKPQGSNGFKPGIKKPSPELTLFMPFLHFETVSSLSEMQKAIANSQGTRKAETRAAHADELLTAAYISPSNSPLHIRRTLDQFFYYNIDTENRDKDQVVHRYQTSNQPDSAKVDPRVIMIDQLWILVLSEDLIVTSFPRRWRQPRKDQFDVFDGIIRDISLNPDGAILSVFTLAMFITDRCSGMIGRHHREQDQVQFLDMFEGSVGNATDRETELFNDFYSASARASEWLTRKQGLPVSEPVETEVDGSDSAAPPKKRDTSFVDNLLDVGNETNLLKETKDIQDELSMIKMVLEYQIHVSTELESALRVVNNRAGLQFHAVKDKFADDRKNIFNPIKDIDRMDRQTARIYSSIAHLLDLKQKHANVLEARFSRDQAAGAARQGRVTMVFTVFTVVFLPLSFIASFFTIDLADFPHIPDGSSAMTIPFVAKYIFGIGMAISIPLVAVALMTDDIEDGIATAIKRLRTTKLRTTRRIKTIPYKEKPKEPDMEATTFSGFRSSAQMARHSDSFV